VVKPELESTFELPFGQRLERTQSQGVFDGSPESLDDGDGGVPADGAEALPGAEPSERLTKPAGGELASLIGDKVSWRTETTRGSLNKPAYLSGTGVFPEDFGVERHAGEDIEDDHELEGKQSKEAGDGGDVRHPDVIRVAGAESSQRFGRWHGSRRLGRFFFEESTDRAFGDLPAGAGESLSNLPAASETSGSHGMDEMADDIGIAADRWVGLHQ